MTNQTLSDKISHDENWDYKENKFKDYLEVKDVREAVKLIVPELLAQLKIIGEMSVEGHNEETLDFSRKDIEGILTELLRDRIFGERLVEIGNNG